MYYYNYNFFCNKLNLKKNVTDLFTTKCCNEILILKNPKCIFLPKDKKSSNFLLRVDDILKADEYAKNTLSSKFDKKYKSLSTPDNKESIKGKKTKTKLVKEKHKNDDTKNFVRNEKNLFDNNSVIRSSLKSRKTSLRNKKNKLNIEKKDINRKILNSYPNEDKKNILSKVIFLESPISVQELSSKINVHEAEIITYLFLRKSISATINQVLDIDIAYEVIDHYGFSVSQSSPYMKDKSLSDSSIQPEVPTLLSGLSRRFPIITVLGHVDHGKTTLLESILKINLLREEQGGITQSIDAYEIVHEYNSQKFTLVFLDTPGHQSFKSIRLRGAKITDIILLVVSVDDGVKPQTVECIKYIKQMSLKCIVVLTKADKTNDGVQRIKEDLAKYDILSDDWGGETPFISVSAISGYNISNLLSKICSLSISMNLLANINTYASGIVIDSRIDKKQGPLTTLIIQDGKLKIGDIIASESSFGKVKRISNSIGKKLNFALPSFIVKILCFSLPPTAGSKFRTFKNEKEAKKYCADYNSLDTISSSLTSLNKRVSLCSGFSKKNLPLLLKADTQGSLEAVIELLSNISQSKVQINIISASVGNITNSDIELAHSTGSSVLAFNVSVLPKINTSIKKYKINCQVFYIIYNLFEYVQTLMLNLLEPEYNYILIGNLSLQSIFNMNKGFIAGCVVTSGKVKSDSFIKVYRNNIVVHEGYIISLKQVKNNVEEVVSPSECGLTSDFQDWQKSDLIEVYDTIVKDKKL